MNIDIANLEFIDKKLRILTLWLEQSTGLGFTITSIYRKDDEGVHGTLPVRGIDLRVRNYNVGIDLERYVNSVWQYDTKRRDMKCALAHGDANAYHLHLQVHPNTKRL